MIPEKREAALSSLARLVQKYTWEATARKTLQILLEAADSDSGQRSHRQETLQILLEAAGRGSERLFEGKTAIFRQLCRVRSGILELARLAGETREWNF